MFDFYAHLSKYSDQISRHISPVVLFSEALMEAVSISLSDANSIFSCQ